MIIPQQQEDFTKYKYAIYARKSSEESDRQLRSLDDQIKECKQLAERCGLKVVSVIRESKSAKKPHKRAEFTSLLKKISDKKLDGIIAWAPDRLARNMLEAGMVIDMIDEEKIKDLRFATYPFSKDANGLMLLGMSFVLSKQYSDKLSQDVTRGLHASFAEGKASGLTRHGYDTDSHDYYVPNDMFPLLRTAWEKALLGESVVAVAKWLDKSGFVKIYKNGKREEGMSKQKLSLIFRDSFYYGVVKIKQLTVDLRELPEINFQPMITENEFLEVRRLIGNKGKNRMRQDNKFGMMPFRGIVRCANCGNLCTVYPVKGKGGNRYLYYTCRKSECSEFGKNIRGKVIVNWMYEFLKDGFKVSRKEYEELRQYRKENMGSLKSAIEAELRQLDIKVDKQKKVIDNISLSLVSVSSEVAKKSLEKQLNERQAELEATELELETKQEHKKELYSTDITWEKFVNTTKNIANILQNGDKIQKDVIARIIFVNIFANKEKVVRYDLREPFLTLLNRNSDPVVLPGRGAGIRTLSKWSQTTRASR